MVISQIDTLDVLSTPVSFFKSVISTKPSRVGTLKDFLNMISSHDKFSNELRKLRVENKSAFDKAKKKLPGVCLGEFSERKDSSCINGSPVMAFDIDAIVDKLTFTTIFKSLQKEAFVLGLFSSVSGFGLRVLVRTSSNPETHKYYYSHITKLLQKSLSSFKGFKLDSSTKNISRLWFYAPVPEDEYYYNKDAVTVDLPLNGSTLQQPSQVYNLEISPIQAINLCHEIIKKRKTGGRNDSIMQLAKLASEYGVSSDTILATAITYEEPDFPFEEIKVTVKKNINVASRNSNQLLSYANKILSAKKVNEVIGRQHITKTISKKSNEKKEEKQENRFNRLVSFLKNNYNLRFNSISKELEIQEHGKSKFTEFKIEDLECTLFEKGYTRFQSMLKSIVGSSKYVQKFNPLQDYLDGLPKWDDTKPDYILQLASYVKTDDDAWFRVQLKKMLVRCMACSLGHIEYNKQVFCLVGNKQNVGKTTFLRYLCPRQLKPYWQENIMLRDKDSLKALASNIFILLDEVRSFSFNELQTIKARISMARVKMRLPFAKSEVSMDRIVNFFATTNDEELLTDDQNVRWLVFKVEHIHHDNGGDKGYSKNVDIDNVWAQAYYLLQSGYKYKLDKEDIRLSEQRNNTSFSRMTEEQNLIQKHLIVPEKEEIETAEFMTSTDIKLYLDELYPRSNLRLYSNNIGTAMKRLGFSKISKRVKRGASPSRGYLVIKLDGDLRTGLL